MYKLLMRGTRSILLEDELWTDVQGFFKWWRIHLVAEFCLSFVGCRGWNCGLFLSNSKSSIFIAIGNTNNCSIPGN